MGAPQAYAAPQAPAAPAQPADTGERLEQLKQLGELLQAGVLTDAQFQQQKARILAGDSRVVARAGAQRPIFSHAGLTRAPLSVREDQTPYPERTVELRPGYLGASQPA